MKKQTGIWLDSKQAIIVTLQNGEENTEVIESSLENRIYHDKEGDKGTFSGDRHLNNQKKFDERRKHQLTFFFDEITSRLHDTDEVYVFGPAETKLKFKNEIDNNKAFVKKKISFETTDNMTMNQVVAKVKKHFML